MSSLDPHTVHPFTYVLECEPHDGASFPSVYVGTSANTNLRIAQHAAGAGSVWTKTHRPRRCIALHIEPLASGRAYLARENEVTLQWVRRYVAEHGDDAWRHVRGGDYCGANAGRPRGV